MLWKVKAKSTGWRTSIFRTWAKSRNDFGNYFVKFSNIQNLTIAWGAYSSVVLSMFVLVVAESPVVKQSVEWCIADQLIDFEGSYSSVVYKRPNILQYWLASMEKNPSYIWGVVRNVRDVSKSTGCTTEADGGRQRWMGRIRWCFLQKTYEVKSDVSRGRPTKKSLSTTTMWG